MNLGEYINPQLHMPWELCGALIESCFEGHYLGYFKQHCSQRGLYSAGF